MPVRGFFLVPFVLLLTLVACDGFGTTPTPTVPCTHGDFGSMNGTPLPRCPTPTPIPAAAFQNAYDKGHADGMDASCDILDAVFGGRMSLESADRELSARRSRGLDRYDARPLMADYRRGFDNAQALVAGMLSMGNDPC